MRIIYDAPDDKYSRIKQLIDAGKYSGIQAFIEVSIDNQLYIENQDAEGGASLAGPFKPNVSATPQGNSGAFLGLKELALDWAEPRAVASVPPTQLKDQNMPFSNRIFPTKLAVRVLCNVLSGGDFIDSDEFGRRVAETAGRVGLYLNSLDRSEERSMRMEALSIGLPVGRRGSLDLAKRRFLTVVVGGLTPSREAYGSLLTLGLAGLTGRDRLGVTEDGLAFSKISNPILDGGSTQVRLHTTLSKEESNFYLGLVKQRLPVEAQTIELIKKIISGGSHRYPEILAQYCREMRVSQKEAGVRQRVSAELARLKELGVIESSSEGLKTFYKISSAGQQEAA